MRGPIAVALLLLSGCNATAVPGTAGEPLAGYLAEHGRAVRVERVLDGDTIAVTGDERVRLLTIDAPELNSTTKADDAECGAQAARDALAGLLPVGTSVVLNGLKGEPSTDRYGRTLSNVYVVLSGSTVNVSLWLAAEGWAQVYASFPTSDSAEARLLQHQAQDAHRGVWGSC